MGLGPVTGVAVGGFCAGYSLGDDLSSMSSARGLGEDVAQFNELIDTAESACPAEKRPEFFQAYIDRLKEDRRSTIESYLRQNGNMLTTGLGQLVLCGAAGAIGTLLPTP